jgi:two-component system, response regulator / RNA-binding antiterminator
MTSVVLLTRDAPHAGSVRAALETQRYVILSELREAHLLHAEVVRLAPDVIIACTQSPDEQLLESLETISAVCPRPVVMFATDPSRDVIRRSVEAGVAAYVVEGWSPERLTPIIEAATARFDSYVSMKKELASTRAKLSERKIIERAKGIVMEQRKLNEDAAYTALRKMAMDQNLALAEVARRVIAVAQLLS